MNRTRITRQTTALPVTKRREPRAALEPVPVPQGQSQGLAQLLLEEPGWRLLRPAADLVALCLAVAIALGGAAAALDPPSGRAPLLLLPPIVMVLFFLKGLYRKHLRALILDGVVPVLSGVSVAAMATAVVGLLANGRELDESAWIKAWLYATLAVGAGRIALVAAQRWARQRRRTGKPVLILGAGLVGSQVARRLESHPEYGLVPVGFVDDDPPSTAEVGGRDAPVLGPLEEFEGIARRTQADHLIVAFSSVADARVSRLIQRCQESGVGVLVVPRLFDTMNQRATYEAVGGLPLLAFSAVDPKGWQFSIKYALDRVAAAVIVIMLSPVLLAAALAVRLSSPGPVVFRQRRVGRDGTEFDLYKFRSMHPPDERSAAEQCAREPADLIPGTDLAPGGVEGEDRRTAVGRMLRRTSLDELPQLFNVLKGEMSLVGPRPERPEFVELFDRDVVRYGDRHRVKSGITGWAQVHGLRGHTSLAERVELDNYYIAHWSLGLDLKILLLTFAALLHNAE